MIDFIALLVGFFAFGLVIGYGSRNRVTDRLRRELEQARRTELPLADRVSQQAELLGRREERAG